MANYMMLSLKINIPGESVITYIEKRYPHYFEYAAFQCERAGIPDEAFDLLNSVMLDILQKDYCKLKKLYEAKKIQKGVEYREIDWFILKSINLNAHSLNAPFRFRNKPLPAAREINWQRLKIAEQEPDETDRAEILLKEYRLVVWVFRNLNLNELENAVFEYRFINDNPFSEWPGSETLKQLYSVYGRVIKIIQSVLFEYGLTRIKPKTKLTNRESELVTQFLNTHKIHKQRIEFSLNKFTMEQKEAIKIKPEWETIQRRHEKACNDLQQVVNKLTESGLIITHGDIGDLIDHGTALYNQVEQTVKSNAGIFKLPAARRKFIDENTMELRNVIDEAKKDIFRILAIGSMNPLTIEAFDIRKGTVSISDTWVSELKESHTIHSTDSREKALELIGNVQEAIKNLNDFVIDNKYFGTGITSSQDQRRRLMFIRGDGSVHVDIDALEFI